MANIKAIYADYAKNRGKYWQTKGRSYMRPRHKITRGTVK